jgi:hypothetical protein
LLVAFAAVPATLVFADEAATDAQTPLSAVQDDNPQALVQHYVTDRRAAIMAKLKGVPLNLILPQYKNDKLCQEFGEDFRNQRNVELVAPILRVHDYADPRLQQYFKSCPKFARPTTPFGIAPRHGPSNFVLFKVDIDNDPSNGEELVLLQEGFWKDQVSKLGYAVAHETRYYVIDPARCETKGSFGGGPNPRFPFEADMSRVNPEMGLHGITRYRGTYYVYDVLPGEKASPLGIAIYDSIGSFKFKARCDYDSRDPSLFAK